jgi:Rrf2 family protein
MLRLTKKADYSLIAVQHLASLYGARESNPDASRLAASAKEIADHYGIPLPLLSKILQKLTREGMLVSEHGTNGGYRLSRDPRSISALEVIRAIDGPIILTDCFTEHKPCDHSDRCPVRRPLKRIHEGILRLLSDVTIQDMLRDSEEPGPAGGGHLIALTTSGVAIATQPN